MSKEKRIEQFESLRKEVEQGVFEDFDAAQCLTPKEIDERYTKYSRSYVTPTTIQVNNQDILSSNMEKAVVLVFCSAKNPGGGVTSGSIAQEEEISRTTSWYFHAIKSKGFYQQKGACALNTDLALYVKKGYVLKNEYHQTISPKECSFIGMTAPNITGMESQGKKINHAEINEVMRRRIELVLKLAQLSGKTRCILGAWGCGVFGMNPNTVAKLFKQEIDKGWFQGAIEFAILGQEHAKIFSDILTPAIKVTKKL